MVLCFNMKIKSDIQKYVQNFHTFKLHIRVAVEVLQNCMNKLKVNVRLVLPVECCTFSSIHAFCVNIKIGKKTVLKSREICRV